MQPDGRTSGRRGGGGGAAVGAPTRERREAEKDKKGECERHPPSQVRSSPSHAKSIQAPRRSFRLGELPCSPRVFNATPTHTHISTGKKTPGGAGTHTRDTRAHAGTRITRTNLTTNHPNPTTRTHTRPRDGRNRDRLNSRKNSRRPGVDRSPRSTAPRGRLRRGRPISKYRYRNGNSQANRQLGPWVGDWWVRLCVL